MGSCELVTIADKYGVQGLVILACFAFIYMKARSDNVESIEERKNWHADIKANTSAITNLNTELRSMCKNRNA